jgi:hypothetical protein
VRSIDLKMIEKREEYLKAHPKQKSWKDFVPFSK